MSAVRTGEKLRRVVVFAPASEVEVGGQVQLSSRMLFSRGGELVGTRYVRWSSSNPCVAVVGSGRSSKGRVQGVRGGSADVVARFAGKADTVRLTVHGDSAGVGACEQGQNSSPAVAVNERWPAAGESNPG